MEKNKNLMLFSGIVIAVLIVASLFFFLGANDEPEGVVSEGEIIYFDGDANTGIPSLYDSCLANYVEIAAECEAFKNNDPSICDNLLDNDVRLWCKAKVSGDNSYCADLDPNFSDWEDCYIDTAKTEDDCNAITSFHKDYEKTECFASVNKNPDLCTGPEYDRIVCVADALGDASYCDQATAFLERWDCKIGLQHDEPGLCEEYHQSFCDEFYKGK